MARAVAMRPNAVVLRAFQSRFFTTHSLLPCFRPRKPVLVLAQKGYPRTHTGWGSGGVFGSVVGSRRSFCIRATTTQVNDSGSIDSPLIQSMEKKVILWFYSCLIAAQFFQSKTNNGLFIQYATRFRIFYSTFTLITQVCRPTYTQSHRSLAGSPILLHMDWPKGVDRTWEVT